MHYGEGFPHLEEFSFALTYAEMYVTACLTGQVYGDMPEMKAYRNMGHFKPVPCDYPLHGLMCVSLNLEKLVNRSCSYSPTSSL